VIDLRKFISTSRISGLHRSDDNKYQHTVTPHRVSGFEEPPDQFHQVLFTTLPGVSFPDSTIPSRSLEPLVSPQPQLHDWFPPTHHTYFLPSHRTTFLGVDPFTLPSSTSTLVTTWTHYPHRMVSPTSLPSTQILAPSYSTSTLRPISQ
jgi:hypothetical protein